MFLTRYVLGPVYMEVGDPRKVREHVAGHPSYHVIKRDQIKMRSLWTGGLPHLSGLPRLPGVAHLHVNRL